MSQQDLEQQVVKIISGQRTGVLSSVENNKPHSRYMTFYNEGLTLFTPTKLDTEKVDEIEKNPFVSVLVGYEDQGQSDSYVEIAGTATLNSSEEVKKQFWDESFQKWFASPEDPNYVFLQIKPETVRLLNKEGEPPQELQL
jgi:general stress protein 26